MLVQSKAPIEIMSYLQREHIEECFYERDGHHYLREAGSSFLKPSSKVHLVEQGDVNFKAVPPRHLKCSRVSRFKPSMGR